MSVNFAEAVVVCIRAIGEEELLDVGRRFTETLCVIKLLH